MSKEKEIITAEPEVMEGTELTVSRVDIPSTDMLSMLTNASNEMFCSVADDGKKETKVKIYNAIQSSSKRLSDCIGEVIEVKDVIAHPVTLTDEQTGEIITTLRTVLIDKDGATYEAVSQGINNSLSRIFGIFGNPTWEQPLKMKIKQQGTRNGNNKITYIELV